MFKPRLILILLMQCAATANASYWVVDFDGSAQQYRVIRQQESIAIEQLMLLQSGDTILIDDPDGQVFLVDEQNVRHGLNSNDAPYVVPESEAPPNLLTNVRNWVAGWWNTRGNQSTSTVEAISKAGLEPSILAASNGTNFLLSGSRELHLVWRDGIQPFDVSLIAQSGKVLGQRRDVSSQSATLPMVELKNAHYTIRITAGFADTSISVTAVGEERLPEPAETILNLDLPQAIRFGHLAMVLSGYDSWRFEALEIAHRYKLKQLEFDLLSGNFPESEIGEMTFLPDLPE